MRNLRRKRVFPAFSLVEVMIGMTLLGMVMAASLLALPEVRKLTYRSDSLRSAYSTLNSELESLRTQTFDQISDQITDQSTGNNGGLIGGVLDSLTGEDDEFTSKEDHYQVTSNGVAYTVNRELTFLDGAQQVVEATVVVSWDFSGKSQDVTGRAIFTKDGLSDKKFSIAN